MPSAAALKRGGVLRAPRWRELAREVVDDDVGDDRAGETKAQCHRVIAAAEGRHR